MSDEQLSSEDPRELDQTELDQLTHLVADSLAKGQKPAEISQQLVNSGWDQGEADGFVESIAAQLASDQHVAAQSHGAGGGMGWLLWIGALLLINFLSWVFGWGFWIY